MNRTTTVRARALCGCALAALLAPGVAAAQNQLEEVVVTATRQANTVNRVPLSVTAATQVTLDQKGIKNAADLQGTVPALAVSQVRGPGLANISVRGITDFQAGAPTTGFYIDDTPLMKRATGNTTTASGNGAPVPPLFDLERIEVLRGPQGTLYGGSSEGGTVRYITPQPSLTRYSAYVRGEVFQTKYGGTGYEGGAAVGGPIVADKLGFRVSAYDRHDAGWQDRIDQYGRLVQKDSNTADSRVFRGALTWAPVEAARITLSVIGSRVESNNNNFNGITLPTGTISVPQACFNTAAYRPAQNNPPPIALGPGCQTRPGINFVRPGFTLPAVDFGPDGVVTRGQMGALAPQKTNLLLPVLTMEYNFPKMSVRSITSYIQDDVKLINASGQGEGSANNTVHFSYGPYSDIPQGLNYFFDQFPQYGATNSRFYSRNKRFGLTQEIRFSSAGDARPLSWVAGVYYSNVHEKTRFDEVYPDLELISRTLYGEGIVSRYGTGLLEWNGQNLVFNRSIQSLKDTELAAFGEANYWVTEQLKLTAGVRVSRVTFDYLSLEYGPRANLPSPFLNASAAQPLGQGVSAGSIAESPITPKLGAQYQITDDDMIYATASRGYRPGGVGFSTPPASNTNLAPYGLVNTDIPTTYKSDAVWSYELGTKLRLLNRRLQLNVAVYRIDWSNVQVSPIVSGNVRFTTNAGKARSEGVEVEADALILPGWTANVGFGYTNARFLASAIAVPQRPGFSPLIAAFAGQKMEVPPISLSLGSRYDFDLAPNARAYVRGDWRYSSKMKEISTKIYPLSSYAPDNVYYANSIVNVRAGVVFKGADINVYANNLFNYRKGNIIGGRTSCATPAQGGTDACTAFNQYNPYFQEQIPTPRQVGVQIAYRY
jgi:outer membrane receptor protein involved in Fe transport